MDFSRVSPGTLSSRLIRICNSGRSPLQINKSKQLLGVFYPSDLAQLHEALSIPVNQCTFGAVLMVTNTEAYNMPDQILTNSWTLNVDDTHFRVHVVDIRETVVSVKVGPVSTSNQTIYQYLGCYRESSNGRLFPNQPYGPGEANNNANC